MILRGLLSAGPKISRRETEVLMLVVTGRSNKEIAKELHISVRTAKFHVSALLRKYGVASRGELVEAP